MTAVTITRCPGCGESSSENYDGNGSCYRCYTAALEPIDTSLTSLVSRRAWPEPMSPEAFYGVAGEFVRVVEPHSEADQAALLASFLVGVGNAIGDGPHAQVEADKHPARLFTAIVGNTSHGRKGTGWGRVREALAFTFADYKGRIVNGLSSGEGLIQHVQDSEPREDDDEAKVQEPPERRLLVVEGEFGQTLRASSRSGNTLSAALRNFWDSGNVQLLTRKEPLKATGAHVSIVGHITTEELTAELTASDTANGFANRFLWICSQRSKLLPDGGDLDFTALLPICAELEQIGKWAAIPRRLHRDDEARELWHQVYPDLSSGHPGAFGKATSRAEAQVLRLSVLYAALDRSDVITVEHLQASLAVWAYAEDSARVIFGASLGNKNADRILRVLKEKPEGLTRTEIIHLFDRHLGAKQIDDALQLLADLTEVVKIATGGRPAERIRLRSTVSELREVSELSIGEAA